MAIQIDEKSCQSNVYYLQFSSAVLNGTVVGRNLSHLGFLNMVNVSVNVPYKQQCNGSNLFVETFTF